MGQLTTAYHGSVGLSASWISWPQRPGSVGHLEAAGGTRVLGQLDSACHGSVGGSVSWFSWPQRPGSVGLSVSWISWPQRIMGQLASVRQQEVLVSWVSWSQRVLG